MKPAKCLLSCVAISSVAAIAHSQSLRPTLLSGSLAPGTESGTEFAEFSRCVVNAERSETVFKATLSGPAIIADVNDEGLWAIRSDGSVELVARQGDAAPLPGFTYGSVGIPIERAGSAFAFFADVVNGNGDEFRAIVSDAAGGALGIVVREGMSAPGLPAGAEFSSGVYTNPRFTRDGLLTFGARVLLPGGSSSESLYRQRADGSLKLLSVAGDPAPGLPAGTTFAGSMWGMTNAAGETAFRATIDGPAIKNPVDAGLWLRASDGAVELVIAAGIQAPLLPAGVQIDLPGRFAFVPGGGLVVGTTLQGDGVTDSNDSVLYTVDTSGVFGLLALEGADVPGTDGSLQYGHVSNLLERVMDDGRLIVRFRSQDPGDSLLGVLSPDGASFDLLVAENATHPDLMPDELVGGFGSGLSQVVANEAGVVAFHTFLRGPDIGPVDEPAVFAGHADTGVGLIARRGTTISVGHADVRVVDDRVPGVITTLALKGLSETGPLGVTLRFDDDSHAILEFDPHPCPADTNNDGLVTPADFSAWITAFNNQAPECDQNGDGLCTPADFSSWITNFNNGC